MDHMEIHTCRLDSINTTLEHGRTYRMLLYADDIVLFSTSIKAMSKMLAACEAHSLQHRYRFSVSKCELVTNLRSPTLEDLKLYGSALPVSSKFTYLGCTFDAGGIDWPSHHKRLGQKTLLATDGLGKAGLNGRILGPVLALDLFRTFLRPVLEYCLAICPASQLGTLKGYYNRAITWISCSGRGACSDVLGMFLRMEPFAARHERLGFNYLRRVLRLATGSSKGYAVLDTYRHFLKSNAPTSLLKHIHALPVCRTYLVEWHKSAHGLPFEFPTWKLRKEAWLASTASSYLCAYIFGPLDLDNRGIAMANFKNLEPSQQRSIFLWILNKAAGPWRICVHCRSAPGTKLHLEECVLGLSTPPVGPSRLEDGIFDSCWSLAGLRSAADRITACIGLVPQY